MTAPAANRARILVVDDDEDVRELSAELLVAEGFDVRSAPGADAALDLLAEDPGIALLFTDIVMPGSCDGWELARRAKALRPDLRVVYTTGYARASLYGNADPGFGLLLPKPWRRERLVDCIRRALRGHPALRGVC
jgi:DNA-binding NtrC family response regulator